MRNFYAAQRKSPLFGHFLKHRVWCWTAIARFPLFGLFAPMSLYFLWVWVPLVAVVMFAAIINETIRFDTDGFGTFTVAMLSGHLLFAPIVLPTYRDAFVGSIAGLIRLFGVRRLLERNLSLAIQNLQEWNNSYD